MVELRGGIEQLGLSLQGEVLMYMPRSCDDTNA